MAKQPTLEERVAILEASFEGQADHAQELRDRIITLEREVARLGKLCDQLAFQAHGEEGVSLAAALYRGR